MDLGAFFPSGDNFDWRMPTTAMDLDRPVSHHQHHHHQQQQYHYQQHRKLEFVEDAGALGLSGLDISFDAEPSADGKIRVRIHHPSTSSGSSSPSLSASSYPTTPSSPTFSRPFSLDSDSSMWSLASPQMYHPQLFQQQHQPSFDIDPFFGTTAMMSQDMSSASSLSSSFGLDSAALMNGVATERNIDTAFGRRRVRIALKSMMLENGVDGGEWEVELC
jgi:hypothetical protein